MKYVIIKNTGTVDIPVAVNLLGGSVKNEDNDPIGMFGSGLKYAMAQCLREDIDLYLSSGNLLLHLEERPIKFKGRHLVKGQLVDQHEEVYDTPITADFGQHDWDEAWFIFRELFSNALDECADKNDAMYYYSDEPVMAGEGETIISLERGPFKDLLLNFSDYFQIGKENFLEKGTGVVFKKGVRVGHIPGITLNWGHNSISLNESRKMSSYSAYSRLGDHLLQSYTTPEMWVAILESEKAKANVDISLKYENEETQKRVGQVFHKALIECYGDNYVLAPESLAEALNLVSLGYHPVALPSNWHFPKGLAPLRWWDTLGLSGAQPWRECSEEENQRVYWGLKLLKENYGIMFSPHDVRVLMSDHPIAGEANLSSGLIAIDEKVFNKSSQEFLHVLLHEVGHIKSGAGDMDRKFTSWFVDRICEQVLSV